MSCLMTDLDKKSGNNNNFKLNYALDNKCQLYDSGLRLTYSQFFVSYVIIVGTASIFILNGIYYFIYINEFPFIE